MPHIASYRYSEYPWTFIGSITSINNQQMEHLQSSHQLSYQATQPVPTPSTAGNSHFPVCLHCHSKLFGQQHTTTNFRHTQATCLMYGGNWAYFIYSNNFMHIFMCCPWQPKFCSGFCRIDDLYFQVLQRKVT